jgi:hypothetical protein
MWEGECVGRGGGCWDWAVDSNRWSMLFEQFRMRLVGASLSKQSKGNDLGGSI